MDGSPTRVRVIQETKALDLGYIGRNRAVQYIYIKKGREREKKKKKVDEGPLPGITVSVNENHFNDRYDTPRVNNVRE